MQRVDGHPIDGTSNGEKDDEEESTCAVGIVNRIGSTTTMRRVRSTIIGMAGRIGVGRRRTGTLVVTRSGLK